MQIQVIDNYYNLRDHVIYLDEKCVVFRFCESNSPQITRQVLDSLMEIFESISVDWEQRAVSNGETYEFRRGPMTVKLEFKSQNQYRHLLSYTQR